MKSEIDGTKFAFKDARVPRVKKPSSRLQLLAGEQTTDINENHAQTPHEHHRVNTYYRSLDKVITEMSACFEGNDQDILCALGDTVLNGSPSTTSVERVSAFYGVDKDLLDAEKSMFVESTSGSIGDQCSRPLSAVNTASDVVSEMADSGLDTLLPVLYEVATILASIPATSCSAERSFSALRRMKTYLRTTMGQERLNSIAIINIEREYTYKVITSSMDKIVDTFGRRNGRDAHFF